LGSSLADRRAFSIAKDRHEQPDERGVARTTRRRGAFGRELARAAQTPGDRVAASRAPAAADDRPQAPIDSDTAPADTPEGIPPEDSTPEDPTHGDAAPEVTGPEPAALQAIRAIQNLGDGQRDFAEHVARWAELQRDLADSMTAWASQQRDYADALDSLLTPFSPGA
jgi:hypothetical protein